MLQVDANIAEDLVFGDPKAPRFVFWDRKLRPTPSGPDVLTFDLLSIWGKIRAGLGAAGIKKPLPGTCHFSKSGLATGSSQGGQGHKSAIGLPCRNIKTDPLSSALLPGLLRREYTKSCSSHHVFAVCSSQHPVNLRLSSSTCGRD